MTIVFCLPGSSFSGKFLQAWSQLLVWCTGNGITPVLCQYSNPNVYYVRNMCLGADVMRGPHQKPFNGRLNYDYLMWIDSDVLFTVEQFARVLKHSADILSALYIMSDGTHFATVKDWDEEYFAAHGSFQFLTPEAVSGLRDPFEVAYSGLGFMLVKRGVFEQLEYPWFRPIDKQIAGAVDFTSEDVSFCLRAREKGFRVLVDPQVRVRHEKLVEL